MKQLRRLEDVTLQGADKVKQSNGTYIRYYTDIFTVKAIVQDISDEVSASIYGQRVRNMLRISSVRGKLESFLQSKNIDNTLDNLTKYCLVIRDKRYKIVAVTNTVDVEFLEIPVDVNGR